MHVALSSILYFGVALALYASTIPFILENWSDMRGFHPHGYIILALVVVLLFQQRKSWTQGERNQAPLWFWLAPLMGSAGWFTGWLVDFYPLQVLGLGILVTGGLCVLIGADALRTVGASLGILFFGLPFWFNLIPILQAIATAASQAIVSLFGITLYVEGNSIHIPGGIFHVEGGCSGLGFFLVAMSLTGYYFATSRHQLKTIMITFVVAALIAIVANWVRISLIILAGHFFGMDHPIVSSHVTFGWYVFMGIAAPFVIWGFRYLDRLQPKPAGSEEPSDTGPSRQVNFKVVGLVGLAIAILPLTTHLLGRIAATQSYATIAPVASTNPGDESAQWNPVFEGVDFHHLQTTQTGSGAIEVFQFGYNQQPTGSQIVDQVDQLVPEGWESATNNNSNQFAGLKLTNNWGDQLQILYWYEIGGYRTASRTWAKLWRAPSKLSGDFRTQIVGVAGWCPASGCEAIRSELETAAQTLIERS